MELYDALLTTRAMRRYADEPVTDEEILHCLQAAQQAPSGGNLQPWQYLVVTDGALRAEVGALYRAAYDRYERTLLAMTPRFRTPEDEASWRRTADASRHLADHFGEAPAMVAFLIPVIDWTPSDDEGPMDIGPLYASVYPAVQNFMLRGSGARDRHRADDGRAHPPRRAARAARSARHDGSCSDRADGSPDRPVRRRPPQARARSDPLGSVRHEAVTLRKD